jgi:membrane fusion protein (multidrug efflux system)
MLSLLPACSGKDEGDDDDSAGDDDDSAVAEEPSKATPVKLASVERGAIAQTIASSSTVDTERRADIAIEVSGTVDSIAVEEGDRVSAGKALAVLKNPQLEGELRRAEASYNRAKDEFASVKGLFDKGFVSRNDYDEAALAHDTARLSFEQARDAAGARVLTSPIAGTISLRDLRFGEAVAPPKVAFQVVDLQALLVEVNLPEKDLSRLEVGQQARIRSEILEDADDVGGRLQRISPVVDPATGTVKITVALDAAQTVLRPGMFVNVDLIVATHEDALLVPKRALVYDEGEPLVFVATDGKAKRTPVELGFAERDRVEVTEGLAEGQQVVVVGQGLLRDDAEITVVSEPAPQADGKPVEPAEAAGG